MIPQDVIMKKRDGLTLNKEEVDFFVKGVVKGYFQDYQSSALLMAIFLNGMNAQETGWLTQAMMNSGEVMDLSFIKKPKVDKHSTGGVGDKVSLILAPLAAVCGLCVPMISGRGLGHTGGTLDKLQSMEGFRVDLSPEEFKKQLSELDIAFIGQTANITPADKKLYALRDVTATVESLPLICASIMSKKLAEGIDSLVLDVKCGTGAFMKNMENAKALASSMVDIGKHMNRTTIALITDMNQPLGKMIGNSLEMIESFECLKNNGPEDLTKITIDLTTQMLLTSKLETNLKKAREFVTKKLESGEALEKMRQIIEKQGGNPAVVDNYDLFPKARHQFEYKVKEDGGYLWEVDAMKVGVASMLLGAGRESVKDKIQPEVGITNLVKIGDQVLKGDRLCTIHYNEKSKKDKACKLLDQAFLVKSEKTEIPKIVKEIVY